MDLSVIAAFLLEAPEKLLALLPRAMQFGPVWWLFAFILVLLTLYLAIMNLYRAHKLGTMTKLAYVVFAPILVIGLLLDFIGNLMFSILFLQLPAELTITARLRRIVRQGTSPWRVKLAEWIAVHFLDPFDPDGRHL